MTLYGEIGHGKSFAFSTLEGVATIIHLMRYWWWY